MKARIKTIKASILGIVLIGVALYLIITSNDYNVSVVTGLLISGVMLFFVPDKFINLLEKAVIGRVINVGKKDENEV